MLENNRRELIRSLSSESTTLKGHGIEAFPYVSGKKRPSRIRTWVINTNVDVARSFGQMER